jgi:hypothetical protein
VPLFLEKKPLLFDFLKKGVCGSDSFILDSSNCELKRRK